MPLAFKSIDVTLDNPLKVQTPGGDTVLYAAVAAEDPSLIYLYPEAEVTGNFSYPDCSIVDEHLVCNDGGHSMVRTCGNAPVIVFCLSKAVEEGCHEVKFLFKFKTDICIPYCNLD
ncbi:unnamed protein product [Clonostachys byssicola]|uniref:Uncharacterized protein n=1 Tax=Clonostachys byssicola TaxID=160290 RepID=A0A9N9UD88_9HYPO|nr:unnamed protein product [Clonostachys byssicola]